MRLKLSQVLNCPAAVAKEAALKPSLLLYVASPILIFSPVDPRMFPAIWKSGEYQVAVSMFGVLYFGRQVIDISFQEGSNDFAMRDNGRGTFVSRWDHDITIREISESTCLYSDEVEIKAGVLTPFVWLFAKIFYTHRQRRWQKLVASGFELLS